MLAARHVPFYIISNNPVDGCLMKLERAGLLGTWRVMVQNSLFIFIPVCAIAFFTNPQFATGAGEVNALLETISDPQVRTQTTVPLFLKHIMPAGLV